MGRKGLRQAWAARVRAFEHSGQSRRAWCAAHGVGVHALDAWRYRLRRERAAATPARRAKARALIPIVVRRSQPVAAAAAPAWLELTLAGVPARVPVGADVRWLAQLVREFGAC